MLVLAGAIAGNLRSVALSTTVTLLVPEDRRDKANGLVGTANGLAFAITSVFSGLAVGFLGMGGSLAIAVVADRARDAPPPDDPDPRGRPDASRRTAPAHRRRGALRAVRAVSGLLALLLFSMFNNFLGGVFMALMDPYGLTLMSVEAWGGLIAFTSLGFIVGGIIVTRRGLGANPVRSLLLANVVMWTVTIVFPIRSEILPLAIGFFVYLVLVPIAEASEQTVIQQVVPFKEQGRVFGFAQTLEAAAAPITAFLIGPIAQYGIIPSMTDGSLADTIGSWFGTGPDRGMALIFIAAGVIGLVVTLLALMSGPYRRLTARYLQAGGRFGAPEPRPGGVGGLTDARQTSALDAGGLPFQRFGIGLGGGPFRPADVARLDERRLAVAVLPARLELDLVRLAQEPEGDIAARSAALDRFDRRLVGRQRQEREHLAEVPPQLRAHERGRSLDVPGIECRAERRGAVTNDIDIHRNLLWAMAPSGAGTGARPGTPASAFPLQERENRAQSRLRQPQSVTRRRAPTITSLPSGSRTRATRSPHGWSSGSTSIRTPAARSESTVASQSST